MNMMLLKKHLCKGFSQSSEKEGDNSESMTTSKELKQGKQDGSLPLAKTLLMSDKYQPLGGKAIINQTSFFVL